MRYLLEVEKNDHGTEVILKCLADDGSLLKRVFVCGENEIINFAVFDGQVNFAGHFVKYPHGTPLGPIGIS